MKVVKNFWVMGIAALILIAGCSSAPIATKFPTLKSLGAPDWVEKEKGAFGGDKSKFYGVGIASNVRDTALLRTTADNRARNAIAKVFQTKTESLMKDFQEDTSTEKASASDQDVRNVVKTVVSMTMSGIEIIDHWRNPDNGDQYSLAVYDLDAFKDSLEKSHQLSAKAKALIRKNADSFAQELDKEVEKMNKAGY